MSEFNFFQDEPITPPFATGYTPLEWEETPPPCAQQVPHFGTPTLSEIFNNSGTVQNLPNDHSRAEAPTEDDGVDAEMADDAAEKEGGLRFNCKYFFLTYPQCAIPPTRFALKFKQLRVDDYHLVKEKHDDGNPHYHAIVAFSNRKNIRNPRHFDVDGHHPNIQKVKSLIKCLRYLKKEKHGETGEHVGGTLGKKIEEGKVGHLDREAKSAKWNEAIEEATNEDEFLKKINSFDPKDLARSFNNVQSYAKWLYKKDEEYTYTPRDLGPGEWELPKSITDWKEEYMVDNYEGNYPPPPPPTRPYLRYDQTAPPSLRSAPGVPPLLIETLVFPSLAGGPLSVSLGGTRGYTINNLRMLVGITSLPVRSRSSLDCSSDTPPPFGGGPRSRSKASVFRWTNFIQDDQKL